MQPYRFFTVYIGEDVKKTDASERKVKTVPDEDIICLYNSRDEKAVRLTAERYGAYIRKIADNILKNRYDSEELENDVYNTAWNSIPPAHPVSLKAFLGRITRNAAFDRYSRSKAAKRGGADTLITELTECIPSNSDVESVLEEKETAEHINIFLAGLDKTKRIVFVRRYWYGESIAEIAEFEHCTESRIKSMLMRTRRELKKYLERQGIAV